MIFGLIGAAAGLKGKKPEVPDLPKVDAQAVQANTIAANQANLPAAQKLASSVNTFNQEEILRMLKMSIPGYDELTGKASSVIQDQLSGKLPQGVQDTVQNSAAAKALAGGYGGSGMLANLTARDLGLTSLQLTQQGLNSAQQWLQTMRATATAPQFNVASMFDTVEGALGREERYLTNKWNADWTKNQIKAMPSPLQQAGQQTLENVDKLVMTAASAYLGGGLGAMGGGSSLGGTGISEPKGWGGLTASDQAAYRRQVIEGQQAGFGMNFE